MSSVAVFYQALPTPQVDGVPKPMKPGGYKDSSADIAFQIHSLSGYRLLKPNPNADSKEESGWSYPDTEEGIQAAIQDGADIFWLNTNLYENHPVTKFRGRGLKIVGQEAETASLMDDKWETIRRLRQMHPELNLVMSILVSKDNLSEAKSLGFPLILKPRRGRGSEGVTLVRSEKELFEASHSLFLSYGTSLIAEEFLSGKELTMSVVPPGSYSFATKEKHWALPAVERFSHRDGVIPYNGLIAVIENSRVMDSSDSALNKLIVDCEFIAKDLSAKAIIRIDARFDQKTKNYKIFDINAKPNMTGPGRHGRENQLNLTGLAAAGLGLSYQDLVKLALEGAWNF